MRLLHVKSLEFAEFQDNKTPRYAIASHRWHQDSEVAFQDILKRRNTDKDGYRKIEAFAKYIMNYVLFIEWLWIDTCCIDRTNAQELTEAINSMFDWYRNAELCVAYLDDVQSVEDIGEFKQSEWFRRGWTLQELLAPWTVVFVTKSWEIIGSKGDFVGSIGIAFIGPRLEDAIAHITKIPEQVLYDFKTSASLSVEERLMWMDSGRKTTREEDMSYALYGLFDVAPGANYGEKYERARQRLVSAIRDQETLATQQVARIRTIADWLSAPEPWTNHTLARDLYQPSTGNWLIQSDRYQCWKTASTHYLWLYGKPGCGKTILCSEAIEDVRKHCARYSNLGYAIFYFSFIDDKKQRHVDILRSLVAQLCRKGPALSMLQHACTKNGQSSLGVDGMENILLLCLETYKEVFLLIDALDECPEADNMRQDVLAWLATLAQKAPHLRILATSRELSEVRQSMATLGAESLPVASRSVDVDIRQYVQMQLLRDHRLARLDQATKALVEETISLKADGMFRWASCQLQELKKLKSTRPSHVKAALRCLPANLDETYERILMGIEEMLCTDALTLLRWLAYAKSPLSLCELVEATIIDLTAEGSVEVEDRPGLGDTLEILSGLVTIEGDADDYEVHGNRHAKRKWQQFAEDDLELSNDRQQIAKDHIRLAHFSVKEYLESRRILASSAKAFYLESAREHGILCQSCLIYLMHYSSSAKKLSTSQDFTTFPLLLYAAKSWFYHSALREAAAATHEVVFLCAETTLRDWLRVHQPDRIQEGSFGELNDIGSSLYYASFAGLDRVVGDLLQKGADVHHSGGNYGNALQAASYSGHAKVVQTLIDAGANVNAQGGFYSNALQAASAGGHEKVVQMLMDAGAHSS